VAASAIKKRLKTQFLRFDLFVTVKQIENRRRTRGAEPLVISPVRGVIDIEAISIVICVYRQ
jgi:hypothetical protein